MVILNCFFVSIIMSMGILPSNAQEFKKMGIVGGNESSVGALNYMVAIISNSSGISCGGGIIDRTFIVSAASCFIDENYEFYNSAFSIETLTIDPSNDSNVLVVKEDIAKIYIPGSFDNSLYSNNIAVLKLKKPLKLRKLNLRKLNIPIKARNMTGKFATISGYGWDNVVLSIDRTGDSEVDGSTTGKLYSANAQILSRYGCEKILNRTIADSILCAKISNHINARFYGACNYDEGGPLVFNNNVLIGVLIGVTETCDETSQPAGYTSITSQLPFITNAMQDKTDNMLVRTLD